MKIYTTKDYAHELWGTNLSFLSVNEKRNSVSKKRNGEKLFAITPNM